VVHGVIAPVDHVLGLLDAQLRATAGERVGPVVRKAAAHPGGWSGIEYSELDESNADAAIAEQVRYFGGLGSTFEWKYYGHDQPADLPDRLRAAGFVAGPEETLMVAATGDVPAAVLPDGLRLVDVHDPADLDRVAAVHEAAFGTDHSWMAEALAGPVAAGTTIPVLVLHGDEPVSAARLDLHPGTDFASLWGGGTVPEWRGRGIYRATVAHRAAIARSYGHRWLRTDALPTSRPILERIGFTRLDTTVPYTHA
jgi:GNAT superfamily N-acetyltransferase